MAKRDDTAPSDLRDLLVMLRRRARPAINRRAAGGPGHGTIRMLAEQDLGKRQAMRQQIQTYLVDTWGE